jgi:hypothetical protein
VASPQVPTFLRRRLGYRVARFFFEQYTKTGGIHIPNGLKCTKRLQNIPNSRKIDRMATKYTKLFHCKTLQYFPKLEFLVSNYTIWQPCSDNGYRGAHSINFCAQSDSPFTHLLELNLTLHTSFICVLCASFLEFSSQKQYFKK